MKVGILTFHASHNYGSMLQAYALQKILNVLGIENEIINFRSAIQKSLIPPPVSLRHPRSSIRKFLAKPHQTMALLRKYHRFEKFLSQDLKVTRELNTALQVADFIAVADYDAIITGSDQIWNPGCWDFDMTYLCDFKFDGKRIAYAPSLGSHPELISPVNTSKIITAINRYDNISTRESRGSSFLSKYTHKPVEVVLDPTLLLDSIEYEVLLSDNPTQTEPYIFYYTPREEPGFFKKAIELSELTGMKIIVTQDHPYYNYKNIVRCLDCGPREFLSILRHSEYSIGNSFHLLAFSLIFNKNFFLLSHECDSRMMNLLAPLGLQDRLLNVESHFKIKTMWDKTNVFDYIDVIRKQSINYIKNSLLS